MEVLLRDVSKVFPGGTVAVDTVSLHVRPGELVVLLGPSGCGKTTLLRMVAGLELPTTGQVTLDGRPARTVAYSGRDVAMVFQELALYRHMSVGREHRVPAAVGRLRRRGPAREGARGGVGARHR